MLKRDYFLNVLRGDDTTPRTVHWLTSVFTLVNEGPAEWLKDPYPYRVVRDPVGYSFVDPQDNSKLIKIEDASAGTSLFVYNEPLTLYGGDFPNLDHEVHVTYGNAYLNWLALIYPFGSKIAYIPRRFSPGEIESKYISPMLRDEPEEGEVREANAIYVSELLKFNDTVGAADTLASFCVPSDTEKSIRTHPDMYKLREKLLAENADKLDDPAVIAKIQNELIALDAEWLKGDVSEGFIISGKMKNVVRPRTFMMYGGEAGFGDGVTIDLVTPSLEEGWDMGKLPTIINTSRAGSYKRGKDTQLGGVEVKWLLRVSSNVSVSLDDCGTRIGILVDLTKNNAPRYLGFSIIALDGRTQLTSENVGEYIDRRVMVRSPAFCRAPGTSFCSCCVGPRLSSNPTALSSAMADTGSAFLGYSMGAMHGKALVTERFDPERSFI